MKIKVVLVDLNREMMKAWREVFRKHEGDLESLELELEIRSGSILKQEADAWVTPTNSQGEMDGGLDLVLLNHFGDQIQESVQAAIKEQFEGFLPVGAATCVETGAEVPRYLISTPTMNTSSEDISGTVNVALACAAAFQAIHIHNAQHPESPIQSVAIPGLGAQTGQVPVEICAELMWSGYKLFRRYQLPNYQAVQKVLTRTLKNLQRAQELRDQPVVYEVKQEDLQEGEVVKPIADA
ncbi:MAG: macro domain-containing protein [Myxococcales bacterium]|nr:macro domain-containing protein [Myxococcales bacterium]